MSTATSDVASLEADRYLKDVAPHLAALPAEERADLLEDLAQHLREIAAEEGPPLAERLGPPQAYAAELLASAGVAPGTPPGPALRDRASALLQRSRESWLGEEAVRLAPVLRPAWWVFRAYLAVLLVNGRGNDYSDFPTPHLANNPAIGMLAVLVAIPLSVRLGQRRLTGGGRLLVGAANAALAIFALSLLGGSGPTRVSYIEPFGPPTYADRGCLTAATGQPITNLYAYDSEGRLLDPVLLYDQDGQPIDNLCPEMDSRGRRLSTEYRQDVNGAPVINAFPRRQTASAQPNRQFPSQPATTVPVKPPAVVVPRLAPATTAPPPAG